MSTVHKTDTLNEDDGLLGHGAMSSHWSRPTFRWWVLPPSGHNDDGGSMHLLNVGLLQWDYTALYHRRLSSSYSPPWEPKLSQTYCNFKLSALGNNWQLANLNCTWMPQRSLFFRKHILCAYVQYRPSTEGFVLLFHNWFIKIHSQLTHAEGK
jgi:hypothetical protein